MNEERSVKGLEMGVKVYCVSKNLFSVKGEKKLKGLVSI